MGLTDSRLIAVPTALQESRIYRGLKSLSERLREAPSTARLSDLAHWLGATTRSSWLYRWLTKEPEPEVIVIDLRETWTVGPIIGVLDRVIGFLSGAYRESLLEGIVQETHRRLYRAPIRFLSTLAVVPIVVVSAGLLVSDSGSTMQLVLLGFLFMLAVGGLFVDVSWPWIRDSRLMQLLIAALEPPDPPDRQD